MSKRPSQSSAKGASRSSLKGTTVSKAGGSKPAKKELEFQLPPLSLPLEKLKGINFEELKKKTIRRNAPPGEDKKALANVIRKLKGQKIRVQEFVNLVAPYTGDNGAVLRKVLEDELSSFRRLVTKIYETMTQDVSDVLVNEQLQTANYYQERTELFNQKLLRMITEIYEWAPDFDFEKYNRDKQDHLNMVMPLPVLTQRDAEDVEMQKRQEAFHRLQWLKIEGARLSEENDRLQHRLKQLKRQQKIEQENAEEVVAAAETKKHELETEEAEKEEVLEQLSQSVGKSMVRNEAFVRLEEETAVRQAMAAKRRAGSAKVTVKKKKKRRPEWVSTTAAELEGQAIQDASAAEKSQIEAVIRKKKLTKFPDFTPVKTPPPRDPRRPVSPFHYSPPSDIQRPTQELQETTIEQTTTTIQQRREQPGSSQSHRGRYSAPRDTWGGYA